MSRPFALVDVFGVAPLSGNPLAVIGDAEGLTDEAMQAIARWLNLSETTFLLPPTRPDADYRVRIFTVAQELPFAGHPTLGSCHAWLAAGGRPRDPGRVVQDCAAGLIPIRTGGERLAFAAPPLLRGGPVEEAAVVEAAAALRIGRDAILEARWVDNGPGWMGLMLGSAEAVLAVEPVRHHSGPIDLGLVGPHAPGGEVAFELRAFFGDGQGGIIEDPVTGSLNASVAQWLFETGRARGAYVAAQGTRLGRTGRIHVEQDAQGQVWVGGRTLTLMEGTQSL